MQFDPNKAVKPKYAEAKKGTYWFRVVESEDKLTKTHGDEMFALRLLISVDGLPMRVFENLVNNAKGLWKIKDACIAMGLSAEFESGTLTSEMFLNRTGRADFDLGKPRSDGKKFLEVKKYWRPGEGPKANETFVEPVDPNVQPDDRPPFIPDEGDVL